MQMHLTNQVDGADLHFKMLGRTLPGPLKKNSPGRVRHQQFNTGMLDLRHRQSEPLQQATAGQDHQKAGVVLFAPKNHTRLERERLLIVITDPTNLALSFPPEPLVGLG